MSSISIPLILISLEDEGFHLLVEITVFGEKVYAVLDTGASRSVFDQGLMQKHVNELIANSETQAATIFSTSVTLQGTIPLLQIGTLKIKDYPAVALDLQSVTETYQQLGHPPISAIIGGDILAKYSAKIDYSKKTVRLYK